MVKERTKWKNIAGRKINPVYEHLNQIRTLTSSKKTEEVPKPKTHNVKEAKKNENDLLRLLLFSKRVKANKKRLVKIIKNDKKLKNTIFIPIKINHLFHELYEFRRCKDKNLK